MTKEMSSEPKKELQQKQTVDAIDSIPNIDAATSEDELLTMIQAQGHDRLVEEVFVWSRRVLIGFPFVACCLGWWVGQEPSQYINPLCLSAVGALPSISPNKGNQEQWWKIPIALTLISFPIVRHAIFLQGCTACMVPALYGFIPCVMGFVFRSTKAITISTIYVLGVILLIFAIDLSGNCPSEPIPVDDYGTIVVDRFMPMLTLILGNGVLVHVIIRHSQTTLLLQARAALQAAKLAELRRDVLHRVAHELRTPLNGMIGSVELLATSETLTELDMENVLTMQRSLKSILAICDDVLTVAKSQKQKACQKSAALEDRVPDMDDTCRDYHDAESFDDEDSEHPVESFVLASVIDDVSELFAATVAAKGVELKVDFRGDIRDTFNGANSRETKLRQVILNLVGNALKFTDEGSITIQVSTEDLGNKKVQLHVEVVDTGLGIDPKTAAMLFEPFHQGEQNRGGAVARRHKGTGLGLTICRDLVHEMEGGEIGATGVPGKSSRFFFSAILTRAQKNTEVELIQEDDESPMTDNDASCGSIVKSIAPPNAKVTEMTSHSALHSMLGSNDDTIAKPTVQIVFLECRDNGSPTEIMSQLQEKGWQIYCHRDNFPRVLKDNAGGAAAVFRLPLQLVRIGDALHSALNGDSSARHGSLPDPAMRRSSSITINEIVVEKPLSTLKDEQAPLFVQANTSVSSCSSIMTEDSVAIMERQQRSPRPQSPLRNKPNKITLGPRTKVVVVDDTPVNVKVLVKMLSRLTSAPIVSLTNGQAAVDLVKSSDPEDELLFLMDWHMPTIDGLTATKMIRKLQGPCSTVKICMLTADVEGLQLELEDRAMTFEGIVRNGDYTTRTGAVDKNHDGPALDLVAGKPVTFQSIQTIFKAFDS